MTRTKENRSRGALERCGVPLGRTTVLDPVRAAIDRALADADARVHRIRGAIVRALCGGMPMHAERIRAARAEFAQALADRAVARELARELHAVDGEPTT